MSFTVECPDCERIERAWERSEDRLIQQINDLKGELEDLRVENLRLQSEITRSW